MQRETHKIDATDQVLGRLATKIVLLLRGKHKVTWQPHIDGGDIVEVSNVLKIKLTGKKFEDKIYYRHTGYPGGIRSTNPKKLQDEKPGEILRKAVYNMLPKNRLRAPMMKRLRIK